MASHLPLAVRYLRAVSAGVGDDATWRSELGPALVALRGTASSRAHARTARRARALRGRRAVL